MTSKAGAIRRKRDPETMRKAILDAAEALLADRGYYAVTMRDVAAQSETKLGTLTYHYPTKDDLYRAVVSRRAGEYLALSNAALDAALASDDGPDIEALLHAYLAPALELSMRGPGWKNYMRMLAGAMNVRQHEDFLAPVFESYNPLLTRIIDAFSAQFPEAREEDVQWAFFFVEAAFIHILAEARLIDRHSNGLCRSDDLQTILERAVPYFAAGIRSAMADAAQR